MKTHLIRIGNSRGIRIPKALLAQCHLQDAVELDVEAGCLVIRPSPAPRQGWEETFQAMAARQDDALLDPEVLRPTAWEQAEWEW